MSALYRVMKRLIEAGKTDGAQTKLDVFYAAGRLTEDEYKELTGLLNQKQNADA